MKRTVSIKLLPTPEQHPHLEALQAAFAEACNQVAAFAVSAKVSNRVALHHLAYYPVREATPALGSQMACNAIAAVSEAYKSWASNNPALKKGDWPMIVFKPTGSVHFDKRTYSFKGDRLSLFTLAGRELIAMQLGDFQRGYLNRGTAKEAELIRKKGAFYFNLVLDLPDAEPAEPGGVLGVDLGENNLAATSSGKLFGGGELRHNRDQFLALRRRLQGNGSQSARQLLGKVSGQEARHVTHVNHEASKAIVAEALQQGCSTIAMEDLTHIRDRIKAGKRVRSRLHRWSWRELQSFVEYKAEAVGIRVTYVNPAYTSKTCSECGQLGARNKHRFSCSCGFLAHSDWNASRNIAKIAPFFSGARGPVTGPNVAGLPA
jgi:putative transposase